MKESEYYQFLNAVSQLSDDPELPVRMATTGQIESFSPPIFASWCSRNGEVCIERLERYKKLIRPMRFVLSKDENTETVELVPGDEALALPAFLVQSEFAFLIGMIRRAAKEEIKPVRLQMTDPPATNAFAVFAGTAPEKAEINAVTFARKDLQEPFISFNDAMWSYFEPELVRRLSEVDVDDSISARVRSALTQLLPGGAGSIAAWLHGTEFVPPRLYGVDRKEHYRVPERKRTYSDSGRQCKIGKKRNSGGTEGSHTWKQGSGRFYRTRCFFT